MEDGAGVQVLTGETGGGEGSAGGRGGGGGRDDDDTLSGDRVLVDLAVISLVALLVAALRRGVLRSGRCRADPSCDSPPLPPVAHSLCAQPLALSFTPCTGPARWPSRSSRLRPGSSYGTDVRPFGVSDSGSRTKPLEG